MNHKVTEALCSLLSLCLLIHCLGLLLPQRARAPIPEAFPGLTFLRIAREHRTQFTLDVRVLDHVLPEAIQPRAGGVAAEPDLITSGRFADKRDFSRVGTRTTIRTARRANNDFLARKAGLSAKRFDALNQAGQHALRFRKREATAGQCRPGERRRR